MNLDQILTIDDPFLCTECEVVTQFDDNLAAILKKMQKIMKAAKGSGIAANQIGISFKIIVVDAQNFIGKRIKLALINPEILETSEELQYETEACLSMPNYELSVPRAKVIKVKYQDLKGKFHQIKADGKLAIALQHEIDHTNGITFLDRVPELKRERALSYFNMLKNNNLY